MECGIGIIGFDASDKSAVAQTCMMVDMLRKGLLGNSIVNTDTGELILNEDLEQVVNTLEVLLSCKTWDIVAI